MNKGVQKKLARLVAVLVLCALLLPGPAVLASSSAPDSSAASDASAASDTSAAPDTSEVAEEEAEESILAQPGNGLYNPGYKPQAAGWCLVNTETGLAVAQSNADAPLVSASLVKIMTAVLVMEHMQNFGKDLDTTMVDTTGKSWVYDALYGKNASTADIRLGETLSVRELLYAMLLPSANEAALLLADYVSGGNMTNFMYQMNTRAGALGCTATFFDDPNGLSELNVSTALDMALIVQEFAKYDTLVEIAATPTFEIAQHEKHNNPYTVHNTNRIIVETSPYHSLYPTAGDALVFGKTGSLGEWQNFASLATKDGETYVCVILNSPHEADTVAMEIEGASPRPALVEAAALYDWAFKNLTVRPALDITQPVTELRVRYATQQDTVMLMPEDDIKAVLPKDAGEEMLKRQYDLPQSVAAPVVAGAVLGSITLSVGQQPIGTTRLLAQKDVARNDTLYVLNKTEDAFTSTYIKVLLCVVVVFALLYAGLFWLANNSRKRKQRQQKGPSGRKPKGW